VTDSGVGMGKLELERVFDRFWRADPARKRTTGGTGLGLAISLEDTLLHGGSLDVWARPNQGASFRLTLPKVQGSDYDESPLPLPESVDEQKTSGPDQGDEVRP
jgi:two-component system sensor histidine kinase MtrB